MLNHKQLELLQRIDACGEYEYIPAVSPEIPQLHYLRKLHYIRHIMSKNGNPAYVITEEGKAEIFRVKDDSIKYWIPIVISLLALIISIVALLMQLLKQ